MLNIPAPRFRKRRGRAKRPAQQSAPGVALVLESAIFQGDDAPQWVQLGFDRAISIAGLNGAQITVVDGALESVTYRATGSASLVNPTTVRINLVSIGPSEGPDVVMTATGATGIVAMDDAGTWAGVSDLVLPYP